MPPTAPASGPLVIAGVCADPDAPVPDPVALARTEVACVPEGQEVTAAEVSGVSEHSGYRLERV